VNTNRRSRFIPALVGLPLGVLWLWLGIRLLGEQWLRLWFWFTLALTLAVAAYAQHKANVARSSEPGYLLQGTSAVVVRDLQPDGQVRVGSEVWRARSDDARPVVAGTPVRIRGREGLVLVVEKIRDESRGAV
jgi:membrane protein implicated in regulation of membrane protease activity